ncbi:MAG: hypothetical protein JF567_01575 [Xanthomonadales bacterium]|nr:hypothetical protein [Xanthomonadales bacterium]
MRIALPGRAWAGRALATATGAATGNAVESEGAAGSAAGIGGDPANAVAVPKPAMAKPNRAVVPCLRAVAPMFMAASCSTGVVLNYNTKSGLVNRLYPN